MVITLPDNRRVVCNLTERGKDIVKLEAKNVIINVNDKINLESAIKIKTFDNQTLDIKPVPKAEPEDDSKKRNNEASQ